MGITNKRLIKIFEYALNQEKTGISFFQTSLERLDIGTAVTAFEKLIAEEKKHVVFISNILNDLQERGEIDTSSLQSVTIDPTDFFDERARSEFMQQCVESSMTPDVTIFNTALLIERDLSQFYAKMAETIEEEKPKAAFKMLSDWEKGHEKFFSNIRNELSKEYEAMPWGG
jgi:rubrerythrin